MQDPAIFTGSDVRMRDPDLPLLQFAVAFKGASWTDPDSIPLMVLQTMLGAWDKRAGTGVFATAGSREGNKFLTTCASIVAEIYDNRAG